MALLVAGSFFVQLVPCYSKETTENVCICLGFFIKLLLAGFIDCAMIEAGCCDIFILTSNTKE